MTTEATSKKKPNKLVDKDKMKVWNFLIGIREQIERDRLPPVALAKMVRESIGVEVDKDAVRRALAVCDLPVIRRVVNKPQRKKLSDRLAESEVRFGQLEARCAKLEAELTALTRLVEETSEQMGRRWAVVNGRAPVPTGK